MENHEIMAAAEAILFASGEPVPIRRIAQAIGTELGTLNRAVKGLEKRYAEGGIRLLRLGDKLQLCSAPEYAQAVTRALEQRKPPKLSAAALEALAIVAYFQPVTRAYIDRVRGVDSSYTVGVLLERGLIEPAGKLDVPGHPMLYQTGDVFLRTMNISDLKELPELPDTDTDEGIIALQNKIEALQQASLPVQPGQIEGQLHMRELAAQPEDPAPAAVPEPERAAAVPGELGGSEGENRQPELPKSDGVSRQGEGTD